MNVQKDESVLREIGNKLANFRKKLAQAIGQKKITQPEFGEMYGGQTPRMMTSYERGEVDPPASMLYLIWKSGNSIDAIFAEEPVEERGKFGALALYQKSALANLKKLDEAETDRLLKEVGNDKRVQNGRNKENVATTSGKRKASRGAARANKKH